MKKLFLLLLCVTCLSVFSHAYPLYRIGGISIAAVADVFAYPVPYKSSEHANITFANVPLGAYIKICTLSGKVITVLQRTGTGAGDVTWDAHNDDGEKVGSGTYIYLVILDDSIKKGKLVILK